MNKYLVTYVTVITVLMVLDVIWLRLIAKTFYHAKIGRLMANAANFYTAILFYLIYAVGLIAFVIAPYSTQLNCTNSLMFAALYGLCTYTAYALTNLSILKVGL